ncbi:MAG: hypothetical protein JWR69_1463 [Pedosphaera sp.]|nr:hypothetical protein [Pedosphaera sp.]
MKEEVGYDPALVSRTSVVRRISWAAIFAGLIITLVVELVLSVLGIAIGATAINPLTADQGSAQGIGIGAGIWFLVTSLVALFLGGWVAGRVSGFARGGEGTLHGLVTWGAATLLTVYLLSTAVGGMLSGTAGLLKSAMPAASQAMASGGGGGQGGVGSALQSVTGGGSDSTRQEIQTMTKDNPQLAAPAARLLSEAPNVKPEDRQAVVNSLVAKNNLSEDQANQTVDRWIQGAQQTKAQTEQKARKAGDVAAKGVSAAGWWSFAMLVLTGLVAAWGGAKGATAFLKARPEVEVRTAA